MTIQTIEQKAFCINMKKILYSDRIRLPPIMGLGMRVVGVWDFFNVLKH